MIQPASSFHTVCVPVDKIRLLIIGMGKKKNCLNNFVLFLNSLTHDSTNYELYRCYRYLHWYLNHRLFLKLLGVYLVAYIADSYQGLSLSYLVPNISYRERHKSYLVIKFYFFIDFVRFIL